MKKNLLFKLAASTFLLFSLVFTGCQDPIYEAIREDVPPEDATVSGNVNFITRYTAGGEEYLVLAADEGLRYKQKDINSHGAWKTYTLPFELHHYDYDSSSHSGEQILAVLADSSYLYLISAVYDHTSIEGTSYPSEINLYAKIINASNSEWDTSGDWTKVTTEINEYNIFPIFVSTSSVELYYSGFRVFQTNAPQKAHRAAFIQSYDLDNEVYKYYQLNGTSAPSEITSTVEASIIDPSPSSDSDYVPTALSAVYFGGGIKFFTCPAATTNETYTTDATHYYYSNGDSKLIYSDGTNTNATDPINTEKVISCLAVTKDSILVGHGKTPSTVGGIDRVNLSDGIPTGMGNFADINSNAKFQITSDYMVLALVNANPDKTEVESALYASITFHSASNNFDNIGLWSYYPERGDWNRE